MLKPYWGTFLLMLFFNVVIVYQAIKRDVNINYNYRQTNCMVLDKKLLPMQGIYSVNYQSGFKVFYLVNGNQKFEEWITAYRFQNPKSKEKEQQILDLTPIGSTFLCWYDPQNPTSVVLQRGYSAVAYLAVIGGSLFFAILLYLQFKFFRLWNTRIGSNAKLLRRDELYEVYEDNWTQEINFISKDVRPSVDSLPIELKSTSSYANIKFVEKLTEDGTIRILNPTGRKLLMGFLIGATILFLTIGFF